jgi:two-component sensor histidine kinase
LLTLYSNILLHADAVPINSHIKYIDLLTHASVYVDKTRSLTINTIAQHDKKFKKFYKKLLGYGYSPDFDVWVKFTLKNTSDKNIYKILEYDNSMTTTIVFYDKTKNIVYQDGLLNINPNRGTVNPIFKIYLQPYESRTYYIKASSYIMTLIIKLNLWESSNFYEKEIKHQLMLALFFGAMSILGLYNLFIYFFTRDTSYLYYVFYIFGVILHQLMYVGFAYIYIINQALVVYAVKYAAIFGSLPIFALALFTKTFLQTKNFILIDKILNFFIMFIPVSVLVFIATDAFNAYRNLLTVVVMSYLIIITIYLAFIKNNRQAYFVLFGWFIIAIAGILMYLSSIGILDINLGYSYIVETSFVLEAIIFSIALADRITQLEKDKDDANKQLFIQKQNETERLEEKVAQKTIDLKVALDEKNLLLKELNHRVKNNMQTIVSLIRLQADEIEDEKINDMFVTIQNRINAMGHLHELLYKQDNISHINAYEYFERLIEEVRMSYSTEVRIDFDIQTDLKMEQAVYCGLILNELITNSFKYAFPEGKGNIKIQLIKENGLFTLSVSDDGIGYNGTRSGNSLGLILVETLAKQQLQGSILVDSSSGVTTEILWKSYE